MKAEVLAAVQARIKAVQAEFPGVAVEDRGAEIKITVPDALRVGHEAHFAQVASSFLKYVRDRSALPAWERPNMLAKYYVTTTGAELSRKSPPAAGGAHCSTLVLTGGLRPPDPLTRSLAGTPTPRSARVAHSLRSFALRTRHSGFMRQVLGLLCQIL